MSSERVGTLRAASEAFTHANRANPAKGLEQYFARFVGFAWDYNSCVLFGRCTQTFLLLAQSQISASVRGDVLEMARCGILKQVQDDHQLCSVVLCSYVNSHRSQLIAHNSLLKICVISVPMKILYKTEFLYKSSWKVESAQLENFYFPTGKLFFLSWKVKISQ